MAKKDATHPYKLRVFLSYSPQDMDFTDRLEPALRARGLEPLIDRTEIYAFKDWWKRIQALISQASTVIFVISPDAVASDGSTLGSFMNGSRASDSIRPSSELTRCDVPRRY